MVRQSYIPRAIQKAVPARARSADLSSRILSVPARHVTYSGIFDRHGSGLGAIHAAPARTDIHGGIYAAMSAVFGS
jgi:hypothetical protein